MICLIDATTDPYWNLAVEEHLLKNCSESIFRLWQNGPSVIIGRNQNAMAEINSDFIKRKGIPVVRRLSGGGAVFHDHGNVNFSFFENSGESYDSGAMFAKFTAPIISALAELGVTATLSGRNDLLIDGRKFSGNAICVHHGRVLQHGTLLFNSSMTDLSGALQSRPEKFSDKAVKSTVSRVTNISEHLTRPMSVDLFISHLRSHIGAEMEMYQYSEEDLDAIQALYLDKYTTDEWNYGSSPKYSFSKTQKLACGLVELFMDVEKGAIAHLDIKGDYFFSRPTDELCRQMEGCAHTEAAIAERLATLPIGEYFNGITAEELTHMFF